MADEPAGWAGILLAGAPGAGKRTVAFALTTLSRSYVRFPALSAGRASTLDVEGASSAHIAELRSWAQVFHEVTRDGAVLVHDQERLRAIRDGGGLPVVTVDAAASLDAFERESPHWLSVRLRCPFEAVAARRPDAVPPRRAWGRADRDLTAVDQRFTLTVRTDQLAGVAVAQLIHTAARVS